MRNESTWKFVVAMPCGIIGYTAVCPHNGFLQNGCRCLSQSIFRYKKIMSVFSAGKCIYFQCGKLRIIGFLYQFHIFNSKT